MKTMFVVLMCCVALSACSGPILEKQKPVCEATAMLGGQQQTVQIYGVRKVANQTEYKAGHPFSWRWVSKSNFTSSTCK
ncbi:phage exclusion lipoprotein Cor [Escherichia coli]|nr:cor protein [Escherichia coli O53]EJD5900218.1 cor protein [Escherichia coli]